MPLTPRDVDIRFYDDRMEMNFRMGRAALGDIFSGIDANENKPDAPVIYLSSLNIHDYFSGQGERYPDPENRKQHVELLSEVKKESRRLFIHAPCKLDGIRLHQR